MLKKIVVTCAFLGFAVSQATAQGIGIGPQVGYYKAQDADQGEFMYGGAVRIKLMSGFAVEASINYKQEEYEDGAVTVKNWPVMATGMLYPLPFLYGAFGGGWYHTTFEFDQSVLEENMPAKETKREFGWHAGGGLELPFGEKAKITADVRYVFLDYEFNEIIKFRNLDSSFFIVTGGILFMF